MGGSLGLALQAAGFEGRIIAFARDPSDLEAALETGAVHTGTTRLQELPKDIGLFALCTPLAVMSAILRQLAPILGENTVVTDVGSVKAPVVNAAGATLPHPCHFVGGHPMAGFSQRGVSFARADLFHGTTVILTPVSATRPAALECVRSMWELTKAHVTEMSPAAHDAVIARVSHLPHVISALTLLQAARDDGLHVAAPGLLDMTRIAGRDADLWQDILTTNRDQVRAAIQQINQLSL